MVITSIVAHIFNSNSKLFLLRYSDENISVTLQGDDSYDGTVLAPRFATHMDNEAFCYQTVASWFKTFIFATVITSIVAHILTPIPNCFYCDIQCSVMLQKQKCNFRLLIFWAIFTLVSCC